MSIVYMSKFRTNKLQSDAHSLISYSIRNTLCGDVRDRETERSSDPGFKAPYSYKMFEVKTKVRGARGLVVANEK